MKEATVGWRDDLRAALPGWLGARALLLAAWGLANLLIELRLDGLRPEPAQQGLFAWDGAYYRDIAVGGYGAVDPGGVRFHPLFPLLGQSRIGVLVVANLGALLAGALVHRLVNQETGDADLARRSATLVALAPPAFVMAFAYAEGPFLALAAAQLLALRGRRWWWAAAFALLAALARPTGLFLAIPALVEAWRARRELASITGRTGAVAAVVAGVVGVGSYLLWVGSRYGDSLLPFRVQDDLRGGAAFPPLRLLEGLGEIVTDPFGDGLHVPFAFGIVALAWVAWKRLPAAWAALAVVTAVACLSASNLNSVERYAYGCVPMIVALALVGGGRRWRPGLALSAAVFVGMATMAWYGSYVP